MAGLVRERVGSGAGPDGWDAVVAGVFERHRDRLVGFFVRRTGDRDLAEDLAHETLVRFAASADRFDRDRPVWPYLRTVAANLLVDVTRGEQRVVTMDTEAVFAEEPVGGEPLEDTVVLGSLLEAAMEGLSQWQRVAVELRCERGWDVADSAAFLGLNPNAFRQLLFRARRNLREALEKSGAVVPGLVVPALVGLRLRLREASDRIRDAVPTPSAALGAEGLASMVVATTLGVAVAVGGPASAGEDKNVSALPVSSADVVSDDVVVSTAPAPSSGGGAAVEAAPPVAPSTADDVPATAPEPAPPDRRTTVVETPEAVPDSDGRVEMGDDEEYFVVSRNIEARTGAETAESDGDAIAIHCGTAPGEVLCATQAP